MSVNMSVYMRTRAHMSHGQVEVSGQPCQPVLSLSLFPGLNSDIRFASQRLKPLGCLTGTVTTTSLISDSLRTYIFLFLGILLGEGLLEY